MSSDRNSGAPARPGGFLLPFRNGRFAIYRADLTPRVSMQEAGFELILRDVVGKAQVYLDGKLVAEKADPDKKTLTIPVPAGEGRRS